jgi:acyl-CoA synthetase (NDP forming)
LTPQDQTPVKKIAQKIIKFKEKSEKNILAIFMGGERVEKSVQKLKENNIPTYFSAQQAVDALDRYYQWSVKPVMIEQAMPHDERRAKAQVLITHARNQGRSALLFQEAAEVMKLYGINTVETFAENSVDIKFPVAVKVDSDKVLHKTDKQGLILGVKNPEELKIAVEKIKNNFPGENFIIQPMQSIKTELILGIKKDDIFGPIVVFGLGGIYTEVFKMVDFLVPPAGTAEIKKKLMESKVRFLFQETRGQKAYNLDEMAEILLGLQFLAQELTEIKELDINPLLVYNDGASGVAVDVKIII